MGLHRHGTLRIYLKERICGENVVRIMMYRALIDQDSSKNAFLDES
jgi:hypothetical protein